MQNSLRRQPRNRPWPLTSAVIAQKISNFSHFFEPLQISETEKFGKFHLCVFQSFTLAENKIGVRYTLTDEIFRIPSNVEFSATFSTSCLENYVYPQLLTEQLFKIVVSNGPV